MARHCWLAIVWALASVQAQAAPWPTDPYLAADSVYVRKLYAAPLPDDVPALLVLQEQLNIASDDKGRQALGRYIDLKTRSMIDGSVVAAPSTLAQLVADPPRPDREAHRRFMRESLEVEGKPTLEEGTVASIPLWINIHVRNLRSQALERFEVHMVIDVPTDHRLLVPCRSELRKVRLPGGATGLAKCALADSRAIHKAEVVEAFQSASPPVTFEPVSVEYSDPPVLISGGHTLWMKQGASHAEAADRVGAVSCMDRGGCLDAVVRHFKVTPVDLLALIGAALGFVAGVSIGRYCARPAPIALGLGFIVAAGAAVTGFVMGYTRSTDWALFVGIGTAFEGAASILSFILAMLLGLWVGSQLRSAR